MNPFQLAASFPARPGRGADRCSRGEESLPGCNRSVRSGFRRATTLHAAIGCRDTRDPARALYQSRKRSRDRIWLQPILLMYFNWIPTNTDKRTLRYARLGQKLARDRAGERPAAGSARALANLAASPATSVGLRGGRAIGPGPSGQPGRAAIVR